ncbi:MAG: helix-hairpin-helix domain-containing protein [Desulfobacterales bacterium]
MNPTNEEIADVLIRIADLLEAQDANRYRVNAYRRAARVISDLNREAAAMAVSDNGKRLEGLPDIGPSIAGAVRDYVETGRSGLLQRLEGQISPEDLLTTVPGIGEELAHRIHGELGIDTLEELELAAHERRLEAVSGIGQRRAASIRDSVGAILNRSSRRRARRMRNLEWAVERGDDTVSSNTRPSVAAILDVDRQYRLRAGAGKLKTIAPRRFNPGRKSWLPLMHTERNGWHFTALYSNTARAHELNKTRDWVVVYFEKDGEEDQCTVVTEQRGPLEGQRVVRGREKECFTYYSGKP